MVNLYIAGALDKAETFPHDIDVERIANTPTIKGKDGGIFHTENLKALQRQRRNPELQKAIATSLKNTRTLKEETGFDRLARKLIKIDHVYTHGKAYAVSSKVLGRKFA